MNKDLEALQFTSNAIELKPDKKYLLLFKEINYHQLNHINDYLRSQGLHCICIGTLGQDVQVIEAPAKPDPFWQQLSRDMGINERREVFKKLGEHLGIDVSEWGEIEDRVKKHYSVEEAKKILEPYMEIEDYIYHEYP
jgi:hypothetical protein